MPIDPLLHSYVAVFASLDRDPPQVKLEMSLTVYCSGLLVSGQLISPGSFWRELAESQRNADHVFEHREIGHPDFPESESEYLHMRAHLFVGNSGARLPATGEILWRCRVDQVTGFSFSELPRTAVPRLQSIG